MEKGPIPIEKGPIEKGPIEKGPIEKGPIEKGPIVVALGGNALEMDEQFRCRRLEQACAQMAKYAGSGLVVTHGNGPQVGQLAANAELKSMQSLDILDAETEGMLGYLIEQQLGNLLGQDKVATLLTRVEVDAKDPAFKQPVKPIGAWIDAEERAALQQRFGWQFIERDGRFRRVVASPRPMNCHQLGIIQLLLDHKVSVICAGGGGIPVTRGDADELSGIEAVIDKDFTSALIARQLNARLLVLATAIDGVYRDWTSARQDKITRASSAELQALSLEQGSIAPKVAAACEFVDATGAVAVIGALSELDELLALQAGTQIVGSG